MGSIETAYHREECKVEVDGKPKFTALVNVEEAEKFIELCTNGIGWPKDRSHYKIFKRQIITMETPWRPVTPKE